MTVLMNISKMIKLISGVVVVGVEGMKNHIIIIIPKIIWENCEKTRRKFPEKFRKNPKATLCKKYMKKPKRSPRNDCRRKPEKTLNCTAREPAKKSWNKKC